MKHENLHWNNEVKAICDDVAGEINEFKILSEKNHKNPSPNVLIDNLLRLLRKRVKEEHDNIDNEEEEGEEEEQNKHKKLKNDMELISTDPASPATTTTTKSDVEFSSAQKATFKALYNPLVLTKILKNLDTKNLLKSCRLVNHTWKELANNILTSRRSLQITFEYDLKYGTYFLKKGNVYTTTTLRKLIKQLKKSPQSSLPCVNFYFIHGNLEGDITKFLTIFGKNIKGLQLNLDNNSGEPRAYTQVTTLKRILSHLLPNLDTLKLEKVPSDSDEQYAKCFGGSDPIVIPNLKTLVFSNSIKNHTNFVKDLLTAAVHLERFETGVESYPFNIEDVALFMLVNKIHTIKNINIEAENSTIQFYEELAEGNPQLDRLSFFVLMRRDNLEFWSRISVLMMKILHASRQSMKELNVNTPFGLLPDFHIPTMSNLTTLKLGITSMYDAEDKTSRLILPRAMSGFSKTFPVLNKLVINFCSRSSTNNDGASAWEDVMPFFDVTSTVKTVEVISLDNPAFIEKLALMFPNVENLIVTKIAKFSKVGRAVWKSFGGIKFLRFEILIGFGYTKNSSGVEATLTGFSERTCKKLKESIASSANLVNVEKWRKNPSILDLQDLQRIEIVFLEASSCSCYNLLTDVTGRYAFFLRGPQLKVKILAKSRKKMIRPEFASAVMSMTPYAEVELVES